ncbi:MAG: hypothetical protein DDT20_01209 [Firmicutes bacterium]|nr:hypothetical protein [Bacillota bacterium]
MNHHFAEQMPTHGQRQKLRPGETVQRQGKKGHKDKLEDLKEGLNALKDEGQPAHGKTDAVDAKQGGNHQRQYADEVHAQVLARGKHHHHKQYARKDKA